MKGKRMTDQKNIQKALVPWLSDAKRVVIAGIGNPLRMDDFVGVQIIRDLKGKISKNISLIECEMVPENFIQQIIDFQPTHILIIDTAIMDKKPGVSVFIDPKKIINFRSISTHKLPLSIFCALLAKETKAKISLILIEPENLDLGEKITQKVQSSAEGITNLLKKIFPKKKDLV
jgi:hydrogenase 3 maturation protease